MLTRNELMQELAGFLLLIKPEERLFEGIRLLYEVTQAISAIEFEKRNQVEAEMPRIKK